MIILSDKASLNQRIGNKVIPKEDLRFCATEDGKIEIIDGYANAIGGSPLAHTEFRLSDGSTPGSLDDLLTYLGSTNFRTPPSIPGTGGGDFTGDASELTGGPAPKSTLPFDTVYTSNEQTLTNKTLVNPLGITPGDVGLGEVDNTSDDDKPVSSAVQTELDGKEPTIVAGNSGDYYTGQKTFSPLTKSVVGLGNVDNTADTAKPVSIAQAAAINSREPAITPTTAADYWAGDKTFKTLNKNSVGLPNVDNTSDAAKPISTAQQTAFDAKEPVVTPGNASQYYAGDKTFKTLNKNAVGLGNVDNTADSMKPITAAMQTALDAKEPTIVAGSPGQYWANDKTFKALDKNAVGLGNVDNTSDANKPISAATLTALNGKQTADANTTIQGNTVNGTNQLVKTVGTTIPDTVVSSNIARTSALASYQLTSQKGAASGYPAIDANSNVLSPNYYVGKRYTISNGNTLPQGFMNEGALGGSANQILELYNNNNQSGTRDTNFLGIVFRMDARGPSSPFFSIIRQPQFTSSGENFDFKIWHTGNIAIGFANETDGKYDSFKVSVNGDVYFPNSANGIVLTSPNGTKYRIKVSDAGAVTTTAI